MKCGEFTAGSPHSSANCGGSTPTIRGVAHYLPERWVSLTSFGQGGVVYSEIREVLETTKDPELRKRRFILKRPFDSGNRSTVPPRSRWPSRSPGKRPGQTGWPTAFFCRVQAPRRVVHARALAANFAMFAGLLAATIGMRRWLKYAVRVGVVLLALFAVALAGFFFLANDTLMATIRSCMRI